MKIADLHKSRRQRQQSDCRDLFTPQQAEANLELLRQELQGMEVSATFYFKDFIVPPVNDRPPQRRSWLLDTESYRDLNPRQVDYVLKHLAWFKAQIAKKQELLDDDIPYL